MYNKNITTNQPTNKQKANNTIQYHTIQQQETYNQTGNQVNKQTIKNNNKTRTT